jgi:hypothetical protein
MNPDLYVAPPLERRTNIKLLLVVLGLVIIGFVILNWLIGHAYMTVSVDTSSNQELTYTFVNQGSTKSVDVKTADHRVKKLLKRGSYQVFVHQSGASYFEITHVGGFLATTDVSASLNKEKVRSFVGNNPGSCMNYLGGLLMSYDCGASVDSVLAHVPSTNTVPTYGARKLINVPGFIEGIITTNEGNLALIQTPFSGESAGAQTIYRLTSSGDVVDSHPISGPNPTISNSIKPYKDGFIVYDSAFKNVYYFSSISSKPQKISTGIDLSNTGNPYSVAVSGSSIAIAYPNSTKEKPGHNNVTSELKTGKPLTRLVISTGGDFKLETIGRNFGDFAFCGDNLLCGIGDNKLQVYKIGGDKPQLQYEIANASAMTPVGDRLVVVVGGSIVSIDTAKQSGYVSYTVDPYTFCGLQVAGIKYMVCIKDGGQQKATLLIDPASDNTDSIDKKVFQVKKLSGASFVSVYGKYIYVTPQFGSLVFDKNLRSYVPDPAVTKASSEKIQQTIKSQGIDTSVYQVISTSSL